MPRRLRRLAVLPAAALLVAGFAACGSSGGSSGSGDTAALVRDTFGSGHPIRSGRVDATLNVDLHGLARLNQPVALHLSGPFQSNGGATLPDFALELDLESGSRPVTLSAIFAQGGGYLTIEGQAFALDRKTYDRFQQSWEQAQADAKARSGAAPSLAALGIAPLRWLKDPKSEGREDVAGIETEHVSSSVDIGRFLQDLSTLLGRARNVAQAGGAAVPTQLTAQQRAAIARSIKSADVDMWTGVKDHTLRKVALDVAIAVPEDLRDAAGGLRDGRLTFQATIGQLNERQTISKPADARPLSDLRAALGQLAGGATSTSPPSSSTDPQAPYAKCLRDAGQDLAKVQRCADLVK